MTSRAEPSRRGKNVINIFPLFTLYAHVHSVNSIGHHSTRKCAQDFLHICPKRNYQSCEQHQFLLLTWINFNIVR